MFNEVPTWRLDVNGGSIVVFRSDTTKQKAKSAQAKDQRASAVGSSKV